MELIEFIKNLLCILLSLRNFLADSMSSYMPFSIARDVANVINCLLPASAIYIALRFFGREKVDRIVFYVLLSLWILTGTIIVLAKVVFS